jgi:ketosteroid isomerase-like protein
MMIGNEETNMTAAAKTIATAAFAVLLCALPAAAEASPADVKQIEGLEARFAAAVNAGNINAIMKVYVPGQSLFVFDVVPPRDYVGAAAYRKDWESFLAMTKGPVKFTVSDLVIGADRNLAYSHSIQSLTATDKNGKPLDLTVRVTDIYRKVHGRWLIEHEHVSVPVDLATDKADLASKP